MFGDAGDDFLSGGTARDQLFGGPGNDTLNAVEPVGALSEGVVDCGPGVDVAYADRRDLRATRFVNCETVTPGSPPGTSDPAGVQHIGGPGS